jgi:hypothetical protein
MKHWSKYLAIIAIVGMISAARAADDKPKPEKGGDKPAKADKPAKQKAVRGEVVSVDGSTLKVKTGKKGQEQEVNVATDANTVVMIEGKPAKLADLKPGQKVQITPDTGTAAKIAVPAAKPKKENAGKPAEKGEKKPAEAK